MARIVNAVDVIFSLGAIVVGCSTGATLNVTRAMDPATCGASNGWSQKSPGLKNWTGSVSAIARVFDAGEVATNVDAFDIFEMLDEGTEVDVEYGTKETGTKRFAGKAFISGLTWTQPDSGVVTWSADIEGNGAIAVKTVI